MRRAWVIVFALCLSACGGPNAALWLRVEAPLVVPDAADELHVTVDRGGANIFDRTYDLSNGPQFPLTLALTTTNEANIGSAVTVTVTALLKGAIAQPWATKQDSVSLSDGDYSELTMVLCECP
jgi:hypothetical protein